MRKTKFKLSALISLILCFAICLTAAFSLLFSPRQTASAERATDNFTVIGEKGDKSHDDLWIDGNNIFNGELLSQLYTALAGVDNYDDLENKVKTDPDKALTSADFRTQQGGKNVSVWFAGKKWDVVYLTMDKTEKSLVLDLWQSADNVTEISKYANRSSASDNPTANYPDHLYSTSLIRVQTLNNGGYMSTSGTALAAKTEKDTNNEYARFTMTAEELEGTDQESVREYLVQPQNVAYQETENAYGNSTSSYTFPNDAYGTPSGAQWSSSNYNYAGKGDSSKPESKYEAWQQDYLWLPSLAETGNSNNADNQNGLWKTDASLRSTESKNIKSTTYERAWLRSGGYNNAYGAYFLNTSGGHGSYGVSTEYLVRPALHLNLTSAAEAAGGLVLAMPTGDELNKTVTYTGTEQEFELPDITGASYSPVAVGDSTEFFKNDPSSKTKKIVATDVGKYQVTVTPPTDGWKGGEHDPVTYTLEIQQAEISVDWSKGFSQTQAHLYHADGDKIALKLPEATEEGFPLSLKGKTTLSAEDITLTYIIDTHEENKHDDKKKEIEDKIDKANGGDPSELTALGDWAAYSKGGKYRNKKGDEIDFDVSKPLGYCVIFKAEDPAGNHKTLYGYFSVHIFTEKVTITLTEDFNLPPEVEYGEVTHTQKSLREEVFKKIQKVEISTTDDELTDDTDTWKTKLESEAESGKFKFYFRDNSQVGQGKRYDVVDGDIDDGTRLDAGKTYYLFLEYLGDPKEDGSANYITFEWKQHNGDVKRPSFKVVARKITVTLNVTGSHTYNENPTAANWVTVTPSRTQGNWYGTKTDPGVDILKTQFKLKKSDNTGSEYTAPSKDMPAGAYTVTATSGNGNYEFTATGTYTVEQAEYNITFGNVTTDYTGQPIECTISGLPDGVSATYSYSGDGISYGPLETAPTDAGTYTVTATFANTNANYKTPDQKTAKLTINKIKLQFRANPSSNEYDGATKSVGVVFENLAEGETLTQGTDYTLTFEVSGGGELDGGLPKGVGSYKITVTLKDTGKTKNYEIEEGESCTYSIELGGLTKPTASGGQADISGNYTGLNYQISVQNFDDGKMEAEIVSSGDGAAGASFTGGTFTAKNVGTYTLIIKITDTTSNQWEGGGTAEVRFTITISKTELTVTAKPNSVTYGSAATGAGVDFDGFVGGENQSNLSGTLDYDFTGYTVGSPVGSDYRITPKSYTSYNYDIKFVAGTLTVNPKPIDVTIGDGGHSFNKQPQSEFTLTAGAGELVGSDTTAVFDGLITFYVKSGGVRQELTSALAVGEYELCADDGVYGNYSVTFTSGTYSVTNESIAAPTEDTNEYTYTGKEITYMPEGFDPLTMEIEGNGNVKTDAGTYQVKVRTADPDAIFEGYGTREIIFEFVIKPAKIVKLNDNGNVFIQEEVTGSTGNHAVMLAEKDESGKFANFDAVNGQKITIWATAPFPYVSGNMPARPEFDGRSRSAVYTDITALNTNDEEYPLTVDLRTVGKYVVYYLIEADNHEPLEGEWRVAVQPDSEVTKIIFKKAVELSYGDVPTADELFTMLKNSHSDYLEITRDGKDVAGEFLSEATGVTYGLWRKNQFGKYYDCGEYYINFVLPENSSRTVIYREGGNDSAADTNRDKLKITQRELSVKWNKLTYVISERQPISLTELTELAALDTSNMADDGGNVTVRFELEGGGQIITAAGEYRVTAVLEGTNAKNYRFADSTTVTNTVVVTAATVPDEPSEEPPAADEPPAEEKPQTPPQTTDGKDGIPWWVWLIVGVGAALIIAAIVVAVVVIKRKKPEKEVIVRDINTDDDGFYDDADSGSGSGSDGGEDKK